MLYMLVGLLIGYFLLGQIVSNLFGQVVEGVSGSIGAGAESEDVEPLGEEYYEE